MADVLIKVKGMKMPEVCLDCCLIDFFAESWFCTADKELRNVVSYEPRPEWCPLVEVPTHGRLIDADELLKRKGDCYDHEGHLLYAVGTGDIMIAPTVIEASEDGEEE